MPLSVHLVSSLMASNPNLTYIASISRSLVELWESPFICSAISSRPVSVIKKLSCYHRSAGCLCCSDIDLPIKLYASTGQSGGGCALYDSSNSYNGLEISVGNFARSD